MKIIKIIENLAWYWSKIWLNKIKIFRNAYQKTISFFWRISWKKIVDTIYWFKIKIIKSGTFLEKELEDKWYWEKWTSELFLKEINDWDIFIDVWANIGYYSLLIAKKKNWVKIVSIEPTKKIFDILVENININYFNNITSINIWVGAKKESVIISYNPTNPGWSSIVNMDLNENFDKETIEIDSLDNILQDYKKINFIKMDIEGYEYEAFKWMKNIIKNNENLKMIIEFSPDYYFNLYKIDISKKFLDEIFSYWFKVSEISEIDWSLKEIKMNDIIDKQVNLLLIKE